MDTNMKNISKQFQFCVKPNTSYFLVTKPLFKSYNSALTMLSTTIRVAVLFPIPSIIIETHPGPIDVSNVIRRGPIL